MRKVSKHIIHCSDSTFGDVDIIRLWHKARGFDDVGYHFVILPSGEVQAGRVMDRDGAHCAGHNDDSIGTCLIGKDEFTKEQFLALKQLHKILQNVYPGITAHPHNEFNKHKTCPNFDVKDVLEKKE